jgi:hypothetical protein
MAIATPFIILIILIAVFILYNSYFFQSLLKQFISKNKFSNEFKERVKGKYYSKGHYNADFEFLSSRDYIQLKRRNKVEYRSCYNAVSFKTVDSVWELFFVLERDGIRYKEKLILRCFPYNMRIKSEGTAEKSLSRLHVFSNNRYLSGIIEGAELSEIFESILKYNGDIIHIYNNNLSCKLNFNYKEISVDDVMSMINKIHTVKNKVYRRGIMEY